MATLKDIARSIANNENLKGRDADAFVTAIVDTILEGLERDRIVKIKGFGTFKLTAVRDRESINVNTGERVVISGHDKITFTPVDEVRDLVNRPFAQFETVIVGENVDIEKLNSVEEPVIEEPVVEEPVAEEPVVEEPIIVEMKPAAETVVTEEPQVTEKPEAEPEVPSEEEPETEPEVPSEEEPEMLQIIEDPETEEEEPDHDSTNTFLICLVVGIICFVAGYLCREYNVLSMITSKQATPTELPAAPADTLKDTTTVALQQTADTIAMSEPTQNEVQFEEKKAEEVKAEEKKDKKKEEEEFDPKKYYKDPRVRTGAYYIVGIDKTVVVKKGQTLQYLSLRHLGPGMECYMEALNDTKEVKEGDVVKIPKLRVKKIKNFR